MTKNSTMSNTNNMNNMKNTDFNQLNESYQACIHGIIRKLEERYDFSADDFRDDLAQEGSIALWDAYKHYDPSKASFRTYATEAIYWAVKKAFDAERDYILQHESYDVELSEDDEESEDKWSICPAEETWNADYRFSARDPRKECEQLLSRISETDREIVREVLGLNTGFVSSFQSVAEEVGLSPERVRQRFNSAMNRLMHAA